MPVFDPELLTAYIVAALALSASPGPDMLFCFATGVAHGARGGLAAALGIFLGLVVHAGAMTLGLASLVAASPLAFEVIRWAGAAYLVWIAVQTFRSAPISLPAEGTDVSGRLEAGGFAAVVRRGFITCVLNPKLILFLLSFLPQFIRPEAGPVAVQTLMLCLILVVPGFAINLAVGLSGGGLARWLRRHPFWVRAQNWFLGAVFLGLAARLLWSARSAA